MDQFERNELGQQIPADENSVVDDIQKTVQLPAQEPVKPIERQDQPACEPEEEKVTQIRVQVPARPAAAQTQLPPMQPRTVPQAQPRVTAPVQPARPQVPVRPAYPQTPVRPAQPVRQYTQAPVQPMQTQAPAQPAQPMTKPVQPQPQAQLAQPMTKPMQPQPSYGYVKSEPKKKKKNHSNWWKAPVAMLLAIVLVAGSSLATAVVVSKYSNAKWAQEFQLYQQVVDKKLEVAKDSAPSGNNAGSDGDAQVNPVAPAGEGMTPAQVYSKNVGAVVAIANEGVSTNIYGQVSRTASSGSGFVISADGYVVSNYHVVEGAEKLTVIMSDGTEHVATLVGYDESSDVSLLKIDAQGLTYSVLGSSGDLVVGDQVCAIGNPLGELTSTLTVGYVSAMDRQISTESGAMNMIQTDAAINSGNSGGPLYNTKGEVVGINTAKYSGTSSSGATIEGIGFAIPIDDVKDILEDLKEQGYVSSAYIGVEVRDVDSAGVGYGLPEGAFVQAVVSGCAAEKAGVQAQDIIINVGGHEIKSVNDLMKALRKVEIGKETTITVYRAGQQVNLKIVPEAKKQS